ncbi:MAG: NAD-dependent epimerase/dehydratase family protein [Planctomycetota bacterium]|nr:NAD-dependent epimerase/dehydratase family protein [Planctomycetota bacterium]
MRDFDVRGKRVLLTGATGFIGSHLIGALSAAGADLVVLVRRTSSLRWLEGISHRRVVADLAQADDLTEAVDGVELVFHLAGVLRASNRSAYMEGNVDGTRHLLSALMELPTPPRVIHLSSLAAAGPSPEGKPWNEADPVRPMGLYGESKKMAEDVVREMREDLPTVVLRPPMVYGPREADFLGICRAVRHGVLPHLGRGKRTMSLVHVQDLVDAIIEAARRAPAGGTYYVAHPEILSWEDLLSGVASALGVRGRRLVIPEWIIRVAATAGEWATRITGKETIINKERTVEWRHRHWVCDPSLAEREWGFRARIPYRLGIVGTVEWYRREGWL